MPNDMHLFLVLCCLVPLCLGCSDKAKRGLTIPDDYDPETLPTTSPTEIRVLIKVMEITKVNDKEQEMTASLEVVSEWFEPRVSLEGQDKEILHKDQSIAECLWNPRLKFEQTSNHAKDGELLKPSSHRLTLTRLSNASRTLVTHRTILSLDQRCPFMRFNNFPFDDQFCSVFLASSIYSDKEVRIMGGVTEALPKKLQKVLSYDVNVEKGLGRLIDFIGAGSKKDEVVLYPDKSIFGFEVFLGRKSLKFAPYFVLAQFLVMTSWLSFAIQPSVVPGRMSLLVTVCLMLINMLIRFSDSAPMASAATMIEIYMMASGQQVMLAIFEYGVILYFMRRRDQLMQKQRKKIGMTENDGNLRSVIKDGDLPERLDLFCPFICIVINIIFNVIFWAIAFSRR